MKGLVSMQSFLKHNVFSYLKVNSLFFKKIAGVPNYPGLTG